MAKNIAVLVHGTFAKDATWIEPRSSLALHLAAVLPDAVCMPFRWSGGNSHSQRLTASRELAEFLEGLSYYNPAAAIHLVGHSHGGNVILYALREHPDIARIASISFLGTPFLTRKKRDVEGQFAFFLPAAQYGLLFLGIFLGASVIANAATLPSGTIWQDLLGFSIMVGTPLLFGLIGYRLGAPIARWLGQLAARSQARWTAKLAPAALPCRTFIASVPRDEAGALLAFWDRLAFLPLWVAEHVRHLATGVATGLGVGLALVVFAAMVSGMMESAGAVDAARVDFIGRSLGTVLGAVALALASLALIAVLTAFGGTLLAAALRGLPIAFGGEDPLMVLALRIKPQRVPEVPLPGGSAVHSFAVKSSFWSVHHSTFYDEPQVLQQLGEWIAQPAPDPLSQPVASVTGPEDSKPGETGVQLIGLAATLLVLAAGGAYAALDPAGFSQLAETWLPD